MWIVVLSASLFLGAADGNARAQTSAILPNVQQIVERAVNYVITNEDTNTALFNRHYKYTRVRTWVYHNEAGKLTDFKQTQTKENTAQAGPEGGNPKYLVKGRDLVLRPYPVKNIVARFDFTLIGEESVNGRKAYVIGFVPRKKLPVLQLYDSLINKATGKVWVDEQDYAIAKAQFHLIPPIKLAYGLVGQIAEFSCTVLRSRTVEGLWFVRRMDWHLDGRLITVSRKIDYHDDRAHQLPIIANRQAGS
jgi:hypothetical protein